MLFDSGQTYSGRAYSDCIASAHKHHVPIIIARRGVRWISGDGVALGVLAPSMPFLADTGDDVNENSIVVMLHAGVFHELMGDAGEASESRLLTLCHPGQRRGAAKDKTGGGRSTTLAVTSCGLLGADVRRRDVVKVGHHGSSYASTAVFAAAAQPRIAVPRLGGTTRSAIRQPNGSVRRNRVRRPEAGDNASVRWPPIDCEPVTGGENNA